MEKIKKGCKLKFISLIVVVLFLFNNTAFGIDLYRESSLRIPLLSSKNEIVRRRFLQVSAVVATENRFAKSMSAEKYSLQKDIAENLYSSDQKTREAAKDRLLKIASQDQRILIYLLELLINEDIRAEASGKERDKIFSSMLQELSQNANAQEAFLLIFKYGINQRIRQKAIIFFATLYKFLDNKQRVGREHDYLPDFYNALIDPNMRYAAQVILSKIAEENANVRHIIIKDLLSMRELAEFRSNGKALNFLDEALDQLAKPESLLMTLGLFKYNIRMQVIKRLAMAKNLNENTPKDSNTVDMIKDFLEDSEMRELAIDILTKIAPKRREFRRALCEQSFIADIFGDTKTSEQCLNTMRQLINESQDLVPWFLYLDSYISATLSKVLTVISMASDDILGKIEFVSNRTKAEEDRLSEAEIAFSIRHVKQLTDLSMIPLYRDRIMSILSRINVNYQGFEELLDSIKEAYPGIYEKRQQLLIDTNPMRALLEQLKEIHSDIDKKRQQFMDRLKSAIKDPRIVERDVSYKDAQAYLDSISGWGDSLTGESYLRYRQIGLQIDLSDLFTMFDNPDYSDIRQQIFNKIASAKN
ncbi:MAG: hypothetical protein Q8N76_02170, partial [Candidatus Omnitrophota bacterium]|nr:hypothetical protein [Candidatus Omnitrophota bacterium]